MIFSAQEYHQALSYERDCFVCGRPGPCDHREPMVELALAARAQGRKRKNGSSARYHLEDSAPWRWDGATRCSHGAVIASNGHSRSRAERQFDSKGEK